ncbi:MAG: hypothetical protein QE263_05840 [Vampirovibrionales bacterium]|nr:hypothetical protein [Vampirovibrionales bacterium]
MKHRLVFTVLMATFAGGHLLAMASEPTLEQDPSVGSKTLPKLPSTQAPPQVSPQREPMKIRVTESYQLPSEMYGQWSVTATLIKTSVPGPHTPVVNDVWNLVQAGDAVTLSNPNTGALATITVDQVRGNTATFNHKAVLRAGREYLVERPTLTVEGNRMHGTTTHQYVSMRNGQVVGMMSSLYAIEAEKLGAARTTLGGNPSPFVIEDIQSEPANSRGQFRNMQRVDSTMFGR